LAPYLFLLVAKWPGALMKKLMSLAFYKVFQNISPGGKWFPICNIGCGLTLPTSFCPTKSLLTFSLEARRGKTLEKLDFIDDDCFSLEKCLSVGCQQG